MSSMDGYRQPVKGGGGRLDATNERVNKDTSQPWEPTWLRELTYTDFIWECYSVRQRVYPGPEQVSVVHCLVPHLLNHSQHVLFNWHRKTKHHIVQDSSGWRSSRNATYIRVGNPFKNIQKIPPIQEYNSESSLIFMVVPVSSYQCYYRVEILKT